MERQAYIVAEVYISTERNRSTQTIFAFLTAQNCELNAQGNPWLEILEY